VRTEILISLLFVLCSRVKQAIAKKEETLTQLKEQYEKAVKRADHLEDLLEQQRKQLLGRK
jgi:5-azacytidine-induced protein 1